MTREYYFDDVDVLIEHLLYRFSELSPLKLQKSLYFLFAFYAGTYSDGEEIGVREESYDYPRYLFKGDFEAWTYGPVIRDVYFKNKENKYTAREYDFGVQPVDKELSSFIDDVGNMIIKKSDFALVDRSHEDKSWKDAIEKGNSTRIPMEEIANEYKALINSA
ncbi:hypothetical protein DP112_06005 [Streptococcus suis]|uniref:Panacea domain-containing protein n=1 Tax=Streptococcus suis TaxID=1307 RepID=UPI000E0AFC9D|nr:type II toxin-antitoxin system antitoxin SocA domain-containing protein [Streptococcus suis]AXI67632.1 hypothetical protein DP112_06005 [Streptococcus suis]